MVSLFAMREYIPCSIWIAQLLLQSMFIGWYMLRPGCFGNGAHYILNLIVYRQRLNSNRDFLVHTCPLFILCVVLASISPILALIHYYVKNKAITKSSSLLIDLKSCLKTLCVYFLLFLSEELFYSGIRGIPSETA